MATVPPSASLHETRGPEIIAAAVAGITISTIAVVLRFISRAQSSRGFTTRLGFWWDDWAVLATLISSHGFLALNIAWTNYGLGSHFMAIPFSSAVTNNNISHAAILLYAVCIWCIKVSTLLLYARIFKSSINFIRTLWGVGAVVTAWFICTALVPWFNCTPVSKTINLFEPGYCFDRMPWFYASAFINAFVDLVILVLPLPVLSRLQMTFPRKISLVFIFILGYSSAFLSFARFILIVRDPELMSTVPSADATWNLVPLLILSMFEAPTAILALCSPPIGQLINRTVKHYNLGSLFQTFFSTRKSSESGRSGSNKSGSGNSGSGYCETEVKLTMGTSRSSTTAFANGRDSDDNIYSDSYTAAHPIPMGSIGVSRNVEVLHDV